MSDIELTDAEGRRLDGRAPDEIRDIKITRGVIQKADGSAYVEWGSNKVYASVYKRNVPPNRRGVEDLRGTLNCSYSLAPFSVDYRKRPGFDRRSTEISIKMKEALENIVVLNEVPRKVIDVYTEVVEAAAGTRCASLTAASVALADAGLPLKDLLPACAVGKAADEIVLDLQKEEDNFGQGDIPLAYVPATEEFVLLQMDGVLIREELERALDMGIAGCARVHEAQKKAAGPEFEPAGTDRELDIFTRPGAGFWEKNISSVVKAVRSGNRLDGRTFEQRREAVVETGAVATADGSARVKLGQTEVIAGVMFEMGKPYPNHPDQGTMSTHLLLSPMALSSFGVTNTRPQETEAARVVDRGIRSSGCIDLKSLCLVEGEEVVTAYIDILVVNYDGNIYDAGTLGAVAALKSSSIPLAKLGKGDDEKFEPKAWPLTTTVAKVKGKLMVDPTFFEELASEAVLTICTNESDEVCAMQKGAWGGFTKNEVLRCLDLAGGVMEIREKFLL